MNFQNDRPDPHNSDEVEARVEWLATAAGRELWDHWSTAGFQGDRRVIDFLRHIATTCRRTANYLEKQAERREENDTTVAPDDVVMAVAKRQAERWRGTLEILGQMVTDAEEDDLYTRTDGPAPPTR